MAQQQQQQPTTFNPPPVTTAAAIRSLLDPTAQFANVPDKLLIHAYNRAQQSWPNLTLVHGSMSTYLGSVHLVRVRAPVYGYNKKAYCEDEYDLNELLYLIFGIQWPAGIDVTIGACRRALEHTYVNVRDLDEGLQSGQPFWLAVFQTKADEDEYAYFRGRLFSSVRKGWHPLYKWLGRI